MTAYAEGEAVIVLSMTVEEGYCVAGIVVEVQPDGFCRVMVTKGGEEDEEAGRVVLVSPVGLATAVEAAEAVIFVRMMRETAARVGR